MSNYLYREQYRFLGQFVSYSEDMLLLLIFWFGKLSVLGIDKVRTALISQKRTEFSKLKMGIVCEVEAQPHEMSSKFSVTRCECFKGTPIYQNNLLLNQCDRTIINFGANSRQLRFCPDHVTRVITLSLDGENTVSINSKNYSTFAQKSIRTLKIIGDNARKNIKERFSFSGPTCFRSSRDDQNGTGIFQVSTASDKRLFSRWMDVRAIFFFVFDCNEYSPVEIQIQDSNLQRCQISEKASQVFVQNGKKIVTVIV